MKKYLLLFMFGFVISFFVVYDISCTKKVETVNPQITDAVTQSVPVSGTDVLKEAETLKQDVKEVLQSLPDGGTK